MRYSVIIPVYKNERSIPRLLETLTQLNNQLNNTMEAVFVVDGSPDESFNLLKKALHSLDFSAQLLAHSKNFGSFPAIRTGLTAARGDYFAVMAADLQEPATLLPTFFEKLSENLCDVVIGTRLHRNDPFFSRIASKVFWSLYRKLIVKEMPQGGVDIFGCNRMFRDKLLKFEESRSSLIALIFWLGFRRQEVQYERQERLEGKSSWTLRKKIDYMFDSIFAFTDLPIRLLMRIGAITSILSIGIGIIIVTARLFGVIHVPGYTATMLAIFIFGSLNILSLGLVGTYAWRSYENSKQRPLAIVSIQEKNERGQYHD